MMAGDGGGLWRKAVGEWVERERERWETCGGEGSGGRREQHWAAGGAELRCEIERDVPSNGWGRGWWRMVMEGGKEERVVEGDGRLPKEEAAC